MPDYKIIIGAKLPLKSKLSNREIQIRNRVKHPEKHKANFESWRVKNKDRRNEYAREWHAKTRAANEEAYKEKARGYRLKRKYGISLIDYNVLLLKQNNHCALCDRTQDQERHGYFHVDHCHQTNKVRGLLCEQHNHALGKFGDNEAGLLRALEYIRGI